jgi:FG-GAP repeat protein
MFDIRRILMAGAAAFALMVCQLPSGAIAAAAAAPSDYNGDGYADLAIGVPLEDLGSKRNVGAVNVLYGSARGLTAVGNQFWTQDSPGVLGKAHDRQHGYYETFGWALAAGDFDRDGYADLAIGVPGDVTGETDGEFVGAVNVLYGSRGGLTSEGDQRWIRSDLPSAPVTHRGFGRQLAAADFDGDGFVDLATGFQDGSGDATQSKIGVMRGGPPGLTTDGAIVIAQDQVIGTTGDSEGFGAALAAGDLDGDGRADLATSADTDCGYDADDEYTCLGVVGVLYGSPDGPIGRPETWAQDTPGILGEVVGREEMFGYSLAIGDFDADGFGDLAIGVAGEDVGTEAMAGAANVIYGSAAGLTVDGNQFWHEAVSRVPGRPEQGAAFGSALAAGDLDGDGTDDLAIGVPGDGDGDDWGDGPGAVIALYGSTTGGLTEIGAQRWTQASEGVPDARERFDAFGSSLAIADYGRSAKSDLVVGVPYERLDDVPDSSGLVNVLYGRSTGLSGLHAQGWSQASPGVKGIIERYDLFGWSLAR